MLKYIYISACILVPLFFFLQCMDASHRLKEKWGEKIEEKKTEKVNYARSFWSILSIITISILPIMHWIIIVGYIFKYNDIVEETCRGVERDLGLTDEM